jgi:Mrp family chromosome partitioning ATPase/capsular polysaccharide biosynthesis protein
MQGPSLEEHSMTLEEYWVKLIKHWKLIIICIILVGPGAYSGSKLLKPIYQSAALVQVSIQSGDIQAQYDNLLASDQLVQTEAQLATSDPVLREVASHYPGLTAEQLQKQVTSTAKLNTQLFEIDVQDPSPIRAAALANDIAITLIKQQMQVAQQVTSRSQEQIQQDLESTRQQIDAITTQIVKLQAQPSHVGNAAQIAVLQTQRDGLQQHFNQWQTLLAQLELTQTQNENFLRLVQPAKPASKPVLPNTLLNTGAGLAAGLLLGMLLALLLERLDTRVRTSEVLSHLLEWPVMATIWQAKGKTKEEILNPTGRNANVEPYRILRTNIGFLAVDKPLQSIVVTSALPGEGKSTVAANLAIFMARAGKNTLLIDADFRRPKQHELFGIPADSMGLSNAIQAFGKSKAIDAPSYIRFFTPASSSVPSHTSSISILSLDAFVHAINIPNLYVMPSGPLPPNPPELLDSKAMQSFFAALSSCGAEIIIFDAPPALGLSDATILAAKVDGTLVVVDMSRARQENLKQIRALLVLSGARVLGSVMNKQRSPRNNGIYSYYYSSDQQGKGQRSKKDSSPAAISPLAPGSLSQPNGLSLTDMKTTQTAPIHPLWMDTSNGTQSAKQQKR